ncbi:MAG: ABC transporter substrate-binding protein [Rhodospirillaceae bacterium]|jgi:4,5-dihydroxyphthalate decarboxylase|nr:ABC transporter substrate-binding protein [Rhodospirillaceae bacterium]MBT4720313.1 ABC transporter substrate-binding protein [Rhodospirillaceae bacterium]MBT4751073.1 ABC transporter substrate-binding protein [Rhodospirillaceae bacterium]MBT6859462.1 ABC transporter substrate-binding protein [Rhodospirillaceae bacterium]MBT7029471.1 ABC transporter substrate-binding protein [Rhodospirillaceae bacterium]
MTDLKMTFACGDYDRMEALMRGEIVPEGIELQFEAIQAPREIFDRMVQKREFMMAELSSSEFISMTGQGDCPFVALPVFPSKAFRHGFICINKNAGIKSPKDLAGKRIGTPLYTQTAAVWIRGMLETDYGVDLSGVHWLQGAIEKPGSHGHAKVPPLLKPVDIEINETGKSLSDLLADGELDAVLGSRMPDSVVTSGDVDWLFPDFRQEEKDYYARTGIHPIMHLVAIRREDYEANPWIAKPLYDAFCKSKDIALKKMGFSGAQKIMLPFLYGDLVEVDQLFGGDPWPYGVEANRKTLEALVAHLVEQRLIAESLDVDDLFLDVT